MMAIQAKIYTYLTYNKIKFDNENLVSIWDYIMCVFNNTHSTTCTYRLINNTIAYYTWNPVCAGVDAFVENWGITFGLFVPPYVW